MNTTANTLCAIVFSGTLATTAQAGEFLLETDPSTFALGGGAVHLRARFDGLEGWTFGIGAYTLDFPSLMVDLNPRNEGEDWNVRIEPGIGLFLDKGFGEDGAGPTLGGQAGLQRFEVDAPGQEGGDFWNLLVMPRIGYHWNPFDNGFYVFPWAGIGYTTPISGSEGDHDVAPIVPFATLHMGWQFR